MPLDRFIARWSASGDAERANKDSFLNELCGALGVERPNPKTGDPVRDLYVFEKDVPRNRAGGTSIGWVDLYKHGSFLLEAKQGAATGPKRRDSPAWNQMMSDAHGQALGYASNLDAPVLTKEQLILLLMAAKSDWSQVDPSIFGMLLERALNPKERHRLGAHYTELGVGTVRGTAFHQGFVAGEEQVGVL